VEAKLGTQPMGDDKTRSEGFSELTVRKKSGVIIIRTRSVDGRESWLEFCGVGRWVH